MGILSVVTGNVGLAYGSSDWCLFDVVLGDISRDQKGVDLYVIGSLFDLTKTTTEQADRFLTTLPCRPILISIDKGSQEALLPHWHSVLPQHSVEYQGQSLTLQEAHMGQPGLIIHSHALRKDTGSSVSADWGRWKYSSGAPSIPFMVRYAQMVADGVVEG